MVMQKLRAALDAAEKFVMAMPSDKAGTLFLKDGHPVQPDLEHRGQRRGHWPTSPEIARAMLERYTLKPPDTKDG